MKEETINSMICPFVPSHVVSYNRFLHHIEKCKYPEKIHYTKCRFNPYHIIHKDKIDSHQEKCTERQKYKPIEDDKDEWWGVEQQPQKLQTLAQDHNIDYQKEEEQNQLQSQEEVAQKRSKKDKKQSKNVEIQDFDSLDFSYQGI